MFALFGSALRATTHQHALAGVTFSFGAFLIAVVSALFCARIVTILWRAPPYLRAGLATVLSVCILALVGWIGMRFLRATAEDPGSASASAMVVDVLAFTLAALFSARSSLESKRALALVGPPIALVVALLGVSTLHDGLLRDAIDQRAPAFSPIADLVP
jgi:hypothetical protein